MSKMNSAEIRPLSVESMPLAGVNLIEASAGTGKTYTITGLYLRLLLEKSYSIEHILVMTYTEAATKELRERVWTRLLEAKEAFSLGHSDDPLLQSLLTHFSERDKALRILEQALHGFDEASIFTLHGYCKRALDDAAFESGLGFEVELVGDQTQLLQEIVEDFWRVQFAKMSKPFAAYALQQLHDPYSLATEMAPHIAKSYLILPDMIAIKDYEVRYTECFRAAQKIWQAEAESISSLIVDNKSLNGNKYRKASIPNWLDELQLFFSAECVEFSLPKKAEMFSQSILKSSLKKNKTDYPQHVFFEQMEALVEVAEQLNNSLLEQLSNFKVELIHYAREQLTLRQRESSSNLLMHC
ncbi:MAG: UvrD-helicase domain-containing protein [Gammaproteobacteria bacterium]|nr:UvrD-helicase domain-containing protein [Gammaproteobacteria bacterium]